jgi:hypothetical protein
VKTSFNEIFGEGGFLRGLFTDAVSAIGKIWDGIKALMKAPIEFLVNTVLNSGLIGGFDWITDKLHIPVTIAPIPWPPRGWAGGGFTGPGPRHELAGAVHRGEFVMDAARTRRLRPLLEALHSTPLGMLPGYADGGLVGAVTGAVGSAFDWVKNLAGDVLAFISNPIAGVVKWVTDKFGDLLHGPLGETVTGGARNLATTVGTWLIDKVSGIAAALTGGGSTGGGNATPPSSRAANVAAVRAAAARYGWDDGVQWDSLVKLWNRESGFNNTAQNPTSTAYGIPQFLDSTWAGTGIAKTSDASRQATAGLIYIDRRYGDPVGAWKHETSAGWYDRGGFWPPGPGMNGTGAPEAVFTDAQWRLLEANLRPITTGSAGGGTVIQQLTYAPQLTVPDAPTAAQVAAIVGADLVRSLRLGLVTTAGGSS